VFVLGRVQKETKTEASVLYRAPAKLLSQDAPVWLGVHMGNFGEHGIPCRAERVLVILFWSSGAVDAPKRGECGGSIRPMAGAPMENKSNRPLGLSMSWLLYEMGRKWRIGRVFCLLWTGNPGC